MILINLLKFALIQLKRHAIRSGLTLLGTTCGLFLFITVETFQFSLARATTTQAGDDLLIVYRDKRFCPFTSRLPEDYGRKISKVEGVKSVVPVQVIVNHCGTSLDTITFRGLPKGKAESFFDNNQVSSELLHTWRSRSDAAIVGLELAKRRQLQVGDYFDSAGVRAQVVAVLNSEDPQVMNTAFVHLDFLQQVSGRGLGEVTQFNVRVKSSEMMASVASAIDELFRHDREPTHTRPEKAFVAQTAGDMLQLVAFTRYLGLAAVIAVLFLIANTIAIAVRGRVRENAVLQALGFQLSHLIWIILCEGILLGLFSGSLALLLASGFLHWGQWALSAEGLSLVFRVQDINFLQAYGLALLLGFFSGVLPTIKLCRGNLVRELRAT